MSKGHDEDFNMINGICWVWREMSPMLLREGEHSEEAIMWRMTARGNLASDVFLFFSSSKLNEQDVPQTIPSKFV